MSNIAIDVAKMVEILPKDDQEFAYAFIKKLVLAWDPDFTRVTPQEAKRLEQAEQSGFVNEEDINWDTIGL